MLVLRIDSNKSWNIQNETLSFFMPLVLLTNAITKFKLVILFHPECLGKALCNPELFLLCYFKSDLQNKTRLHHSLFSFAFTVEERSSLAIPAPAPDPGVNKVFLQRALGSILRKRSYAASTDPCFRFLDQVQKRCADTNATFTKRDCFASCGRFLCLLFCLFFISKRRKIAIN